jgi:hypothetical protein
MNFSTLVSSVVVSLALSSAASAQWSSGGFNVGVGGSYGKYKVSETGPNGQTYNRTVTNNNLSWGVGLGGSSTNYPAYGGYGMGGYGMGGYGGGWGYGGGYGYGGGCGYGGAMVLPYYGGGCYPTVVPYSPFTRCYGTPMYAPQYPCAPAAVRPQAPICW